MTENLDEKKKNKKDKPKKDPKKKLSYKWQQKKKNIKKYLLRHKVLYVLLNILIFPFKLIYWLFNFILNFSNLILNILLIALIVGCIAGGFIAAKVLPMYQESAEQAYAKLSTLNENDFHMLSNTEIYDKNGKKIGEIDSGSYQYVEIENISEYVQYGYIAIEDRRFMQHCGVDLQSIARAGLSLIKNNGEITQGGSTITQQVIKNNLLTQEQTYSRKLTEVLLAPSIEKEFGKSKIMEFYCNSNYYGNQCYGIETASKFYFGVSAKDLTLAQAAMLCGVSNSPNNYNPVASMELAKERQKQVLDNMLKEEYITQEEYDTALNEKIKVIGIDETETSENYMVSYALYCATIQLMKDDGFEFQYTFENEEEQDAYKEKYYEQYGIKSAEIRAGGYKIYTSLDPKLQKKLQSSVTDTLASFTEKDKETKKYALQSAAVCIDNETQYVVAIVGGRTEEDQYNRAFLSSRQPGSTIKPLLDYAPAIDNGIINASSIFTDEKVYWDDYNTKSYSPNNSGGSFRGDVNIREALGRSLNTIAFQVFKKSGFDISMKYLEDMQFSTLSYADMSAPAISLGGFTNGLTVSDMCRGYATLGNDGQYSSRTCITKIEHEINGDVYEAPTLEDSNTQVYSADTAFIITDIMQGTFNESYGTAHSAYNSNQIYAGKTGTTNSNKDAWFCGLSAYYTTAVWVGYDTPREMSGMYGGTYPLKIWSTFMNDIHSDLEMKNFNMPSTIELRKVKDGELTEEDKEIKYSNNKRYYSQRPSVYDYYSQQNASRQEEWEKTYLLEKTKKAAENAVAEFEEYKINNVDDVLNFEENYNNTIAIIEQIPDEYEQVPYKTRAVNKYNSLNDSALNEWAKAIEEYEEDKAEQIAKQEQIDAEDATHNAQETLKANRIAKAQWYIDQINKRTYYTKLAKLLVSDGKKALDRVKGYTEYNKMKSDYEDAVEYVKQLPTAPEVPEIPEDAEDNTQINEEQYEEDITTENTQSTTESTTQTSTGENTTENPYSNLKVQN